MARKRSFLVAVCAMSLAGASELDDLKNACDAGVAEACYEMGILYEKGIGVTKDAEKSAQLYQHACDNGYDKGCQALDADPKVSVR